MYFCIQCFGSAYGKKKTRKNIKKISNKSFINVMANLHKLKNTKMFNIFYYKVLIMLFQLSFQYRYWWFYFCFLHPWSWFTFCMRIRIWEVSYNANPRLSEEKRTADNICYFTMRIWTSWRYLNWQLKMKFYRLYYTRIRLVSDPQPCCKPEHKR